MKLKHCFLLIFLFTTLNLFGQEKDKKVHIINFENDVELYNSELIKEIRIKKKFRKKTYQRLIDQVVDSTKIYGGDCIKITYYDDSDNVQMESKFKWPNHLVAEIYNLNPQYKNTIISEINRIKAERDSIFENRTAWQKLWNIDPIKRAKEKKENKASFKEFFQSLPNDSIKSGFFEIGGMGGVDYLFLMANLNVSAELYIIPGKSNKISLSNRSGGLAGIAPTVIVYTYPSLKYHHRISNLWATISFGRAYTAYYDGIEEEWQNREIDYRVDIGLRVYKKRQMSFEIYFPIRIDNEIPAYFTGPNINYYYKF